MIYAVLGDIHSNFDALTAVVDDLKKEQIDKVLCIGDIVGYAAEPVECIDLLRELDCITVAGNHDYATVSKFPVNYFNDDAKRAVQWTARQLSDVYINFLKGLSLVEEIDEITIVHGSLNHPEFFDYITTENDARLCFSKLRTPVCFYGHTHVPLAIFSTGDTIHVERGPIFKLNGFDKVLINVGSVGQPRDWDIRACYAVYDTEKKIVVIKRVKYNISSAIDKIYHAGLPKMNALRLKG